MRKSLKRKNLNTVTGDEVQTGNCSHTRRLFSQEWQTKEVRDTELEECEEPDKKEI